MIVPAEYNTFKETDIEPWCDVEAQMVIGEVFLGDELVAPVCPVAFNSAKMF